MWHYNGGMSHFPRQRRYFATDRVKEEIVSQGRRFDWIADQVGVSKSHLTRVLSGERHVDEFTARLIAVLLGRDFSLLWEVADSIEKVTESKESVAS